MSGPGDLHHILVADDDLVTRAMLREQLVWVGHRVVACEDGEEALRTYDRDEHTLLILDLHMPKRTGLDVIRELRDRGDSVPVILMSSTFEASDLGASAVLEGVLCVLKPSTLAQLRSAIGQATRRDKTRTGDAP